MSQTMLWPDLSPIAWVPLGVIVAAIAGVVVRLLYTDRRTQGLSFMAQPHQSERRAKVGRLDGQPWWVRAIAFVGIPGAISLFLVYALVTQIEGHQTAHDQELRDHTQSTTLTAAADVIYKAGQERQAQQLDVTMQRLIDLTEQVCRRVSHSEAERDGCSGLRR